MANDYTECFICEEPEADCVCEWQNFQVELRVLDRAAEWAASDAQEMRHQIEGVLEVCQRNKADGQQFPEDADPATAV